MTWPTYALPDGLLTIGPFSLCSIGSTGLQNVPASAVWPAANRAIFYPIRLATPFTSVNAWVMAGATWDGATPNHFDIGIYAPDGTLLPNASLGSTNMNGSTNAIQTAALACTFGPGLFYLGLAVDTGTDTVFRVTGSSISAIGPSKLMGLAQMAAAFPLPASATFATIASAYIPVFGISGRATV